MGFVALNLPLLVVVVLAYIWVGLNDTAAILAVARSKAPTVFVTMREGTERSIEAWKNWAWFTNCHAEDVSAGSSCLNCCRSSRRPPGAACPSRGRSSSVVELLGRPNGVGFILNLYFQNFDVTEILAYGLTFAAIMLAVETAILQPWERQASAWRRHA